MLPQNERAFLYQYLGQSSAQGVTTKNSLTAFVDDVRLPFKHRTALKKAIFLLSKKKSAALVLYHAKIIPSAEYLILQNTGTRTLFNKHVLNSLSKRLRKTMMRNRKFKIMVLYPTILLIELLLMVSVALFWLVPQMYELFSKLHSTPPALISLLYAVSKAGKNLSTIHTIPWMIIGAAIVWLGIRLMRTRRITWYIDLLKLRAYPIGLLYRLILIEDSMYLLSLMLENSKNQNQKKKKTPEYIQKLAPTVPNRIYQKELQNLGTHLEAGNTFSDFFKNTKQSWLWPTLVCRMLVMHQENQNLSPRLRAVSNLLSDEIAIESEMMIARFEPLIIIGIAALVGFIALTLKSALSDVQNAILLG